MVIYTNVMPKRFAGYNLGPITLIRPDHRNDEGLHAHEEVHRQQFFRNPFMGLFYMLSKQSRLEYELEAYRAQLKVDPSKLELYASYLFTNYNLDVTFDQARELLCAPSK